MNIQQNDRLEEAVKLYSKAVTDEGYEVSEVDDDNDDDNDDDDEVVDDDDDDEVDDDDDDDDDYDDYDDYDGVYLSAILSCSDCWVQTL